MNNKLQNYVLPLKVKPEHKKDGDVIFYIDQKLVNRKDEIALGLMLISNRQLFGEVYRHLIGEYFYQMGPNSGVLIRPFAKSQDILSNLSFPGDIDLLIIPYEDGRLVVSKTLAIELKILRAKFSNQKKSPNEFGFSQASGLLNAGFPYVAVVHLIVSDTSPEDAWREILMAKVIDADSGAIELLGNEKKDMMPADLIQRSFGRLKAHSLDENLGLLSCYMESENNNAIWSPMGKIAKFNSQSSLQTFERIADYYYENYKFFLDTKRYND